MNMEGKRSWWGGWASNPVGGAMRRRVGSTPAPLRHRYSVLLLRTRILGLRCSPYMGTAARLGPSCGRSRRNPLHRLPQVCMRVSDRPEAARDASCHIVWARGALRCSGLCLKVSA